MAHKSVREGWEMVCPHCGHDEAIHIRALVWVQLEPNDTAPDKKEGAQWDEQSSAECGHCKYAGRVIDFENFNLTERLPWKL